MILDVIVKVCAIGAALLSVFNAVKAWRKDRREAAVGASLNLVKAVYKVDRSNPAHRMDDLYVVNNDVLPVNNVTADFFANAASKENAAHYAVGSLGPKDEFCVKRGRGNRYGFAQFTYTDAKGHPHNYSEDVYSQQK